MKQSASYTENRVYFHSRQEALNYGYNFCLYCSPLMKCYRKERRALDEFCDKHDMEMKVNYNNETLDVICPESKWKIMYSSELKTLVLYHKNTVQSAEQGYPFTGYHDQKVRKESIMPILKYIFRHDQYIEQNNTVTAKKT